MKSKLITLNKALVRANLLEESRELTKVAFIGGILLGIGEALFQYYSPDLMEKYLNLPAAKEGFKYELYFRANKESYKSQIKSFSLKSVVGDLFNLRTKSKSKENVEDPVNSGEVKSFQTVSAGGFSPPDGFGFVPRFGVAVITWNNGSQWEVTAGPSKNKTPDNTFAMYITDESIAKTKELLDGKKTDVYSMGGGGDDFEESLIHGRSTEDKTTSMGKNLIQGGAGLGFGIGGAALTGGTAAAGSTLGGLGAASGAFTGASAATSAATSGLLGGGTLAAGVGTGTGAVVGAGAAAATVAGVAISVLSAGYAGWQIGTAFDQATGLSNKIPGWISWLQTAMAKDGNDYELSVEAGKWEPFLSEFRISSVSGPLAKNGVKIQDNVNDTAESDFVPIKSRAKASGKDFGDGAVLMPSSFVAIIKLKDGNTINVPGSLIKLTDPIQVSITENDLTLKIARLISKGKMVAQEGMPLSTSDVKAAVSSKSKDLAAAKEVAKASQPSGSSPRPASGGTPSSKGATTWEEYMAKTRNGQPVKDAWDKWSTALGYSPDDYLSFKSLWREFAKKAGNYDIGVSQTASLLEALGRAKAIDQKNPATNNAFTRQIWDSIAKLDLANISSVNKYNKKYVA